MYDEKTELFMHSVNFEWEDIDFSGTDQARKIAHPILEKQVDPGKPVIALAPLSSLHKPEINLLDAILQRKSQRKYNAEYLSAEELSFLLYCTQGVKTRSEKYSMRTVPSAGARHAFETYLFIDRVENIQPGLYRYLPFEHSLVLEKAMNDTMKAELNEGLNDQLYGAAVYFIWTAIPYRMSWRYSFATPKLLALDAGHLCQNLYLACEAIQCGTCAIGAYSQKKMDKFLAVDGKDEFAIYMAPVGKVDQNAV